MVWDLLVLIMMANNGKILIPLDLSAVSLNAINFALELAEKMKKDLLIFHSKNEQQSGDKKISDVVSDLRSRTKHVEVELYETDRFFNSNSINEIFGSSGLDAIVMGTKGVEQNFSKRLFGTNAAEVAEAVACPVIIIPSNAKLVKLNKIAFASDLNNLEKELPILFKFVNSFNSQVLIFHVSPVFPDLGDIEKRNIHKEIEKISSRQNFYDISYHVEQMQSDNKIHAGIQKFVDKHRPDALVMFHDHRKGLDRLFSTSETEKVVEEFAIPSIIFPKP